MALLSFITAMICLRETSAVIMGADEVDKQLTSDTDFEHPVINHTLGSLSHCNQRTHEVAVSGPAESALATTSRSGVVGRPIRVLS